MKRIGIRILGLIAFVAITVLSVSISVHATINYPLQEENIVQVDSGDNFSIALSEDGSVYTWGTSFALGHGVGITVLGKPTELTQNFTGLSVGETIVYVAAGREYAAALSSQGKVFVWGLNNQQVLGIANNNTSNVLLPYDNTARFLNLEVGEKIIMIEAGTNYFIALSNLGKVFTWGQNYYGQLGNNSTSFQFTPLNITERIVLNENDKIVKIRTKGETSYALSQTGRLFAWGGNGVGQVGDNSNVHRTTPVEVTSQFLGLEAGEYVKDIAAGVGHAIAYTSLNKVFTWGGNFYGALGDNTTEQKSVPTNITAAFATSGDDVIHNVSATEYSSFVMLDNGNRVYAFGYNNSAQLGDTTIVQRNAPTLLSFSIYSDQIALNGVSGGDNYSIFITTEGHLLAIGNSSDWQLGHSDRLNLNTRIPFPLYDDDYTITFDSRGGSPVDSFTTYGGGPVTMPPNPVKAGNIFWGWSLHPTVGGQIPSVYTNMVTQNVTLYAIWLPDHYALIFRNSESEVIQSTDYLIGASLSESTAPEAPAKTGYRFTGWSQSIPSTMPSNDVVIQAQYAKNDYTLTFDSNGGSAVSPIVTPYLDPITVFAIPTKTGYVFGGWFTDAALTTQYVNGPQPASDFTLYAKWNGTQFSLIYRDFDSQILQSTTYLIGASLSAHVAPVPTRTGYTFNGWSQAVPANMPATDVTLTAQWTINQYSITYYSNGGSAVAAITQDYNTAISAPSNPTKTGYTFNGWSQTVPSTIPAENITLTAQWTINQYTITFDANGGSAVAAITQDYNTSLTAPSNPTKEGYIFNGWSQAMPSTMPASNLSMQAYWILNTQDTDDVEAETDAIHDKIDPSIIEGKDVEIVIRVEVQPQTNILPAEVALVNDKIQSALEIRNSGSLFINIEIILKEQGLEDVLIQELLEPISITLSIPEEYRGFRNYHIIRIHNGVAEVLETEYHQDNQTLTFETDRFSTYAIAYDTSSGFSLWWLLLLLLIPASYLVYRQTKKTVVVGPSIVSAPETEVITTTEQEPEVQEEVVILDEVVIKNIEERPQFKAFEAVDNGDYLEITTEQEASNRVVEVSMGVLPKLINPDNTFVLLEKAEVAQFKELNLDLATYHRLTPGSYTDQGYFMEVDGNSKSVDNYVHVKRRLPPTSAKGHRWVRIEPRKIKSEI
jgi:uncharacterized repeat protein (TIGR02543 family)